MRAILKRPAARVLGGLALVALLAQGCILEKKSIIDVYEAIIGVPQGTTALISRMDFGMQYCIQPGTVIIDVKLKPNTTASSLLITAAVVPLIGSNTVFSFDLQPTGKKYKGDESIGSLCLNPGDRIEWRVTPIGGDIPDFAEMKSKLKYKAFKNPPPA
jgi:hypothetical protein